MIVPEVILFYQDPYFDKSTASDLKSFTVKVFVHLNKCYKLLELYIYTLLEMYA